MEKEFVTHIDHLVMTVSDIDAACEFYNRVLGLEIDHFGTDRRALKVGKQKINIHQIDKVIEPRAKCPGVGAADLCFITTTGINDVVARLEELDIVIELGPVLRTGCQGSMMSIYFRDLDGNLIEIASYDDQYDDQ